MEKHALHGPTGANRRRKRVARGHGGRGHKTAGRGTKGQKSRSHAGVPAWFEGGQTPFVRRLPHRRGFSNARFRVVYQPVNVGDLERVFEAGATITPAGHSGARPCPLHANQDTWQRRDYPSTYRAGAQVFAGRTR